MATIPHAHPHPDLHDDEGVPARLVRLLELELELGLAETRALLRRLAVTLAVAVAAVITLVASLVVLLVAALAPLFDAVWEHFVIAGGAALLLAVAALAWAVWHLTHLPWPRETLASLEENWRWLAAQLRSRLTLP
jgi:hypothetical protein